MHGKQWFPIELDLIGTALYNTDMDSGGFEEYHDEEGEEQVRSVYYLLLFFFFFFFFFEGLYFQENFI